MRRFATPSLVFVFAMVLSCETPASQTSTLKDHRWKHRVILLFTPTRDHDRFRMMLRELQAHGDGVAERNLVIYELSFDDDARRGEQSLSSDAVRRLADRFDASEEAFTYLLIGKDGTVKNRSDTVVPVAEIFARIDAMPMRKREMAAEE